MTEPKTREGSAEADPQSNPKVRIRFLLLKEPEDSQRLCRYHYGADYNNGDRDRCRGHVVGNITDFSSSIGVILTVNEVMAVASA